MLNQQTFLNTQSHDYPINIDVITENHNSQEQLAHQEQHKSFPSSHAVHVPIKRFHRLYVFLTILGFVGGLVCFMQYQMIKYMAVSRQLLVGMTNSTFIQFCIWIVYNLMFVVFAIVITKLYAPFAEGSGIPRIRAILNGSSTLQEPLSLSTLLVKIVGLPAVLGTGMFTGRVGSTIHLGALLSNNLLNLPFFRHIRNDRIARLNMVTCGGAIGVAAYVGTPAGGVLFSLEAFGTYYSVRTFVKIAYVAIVAGFTTKALNIWVNPKIRLIPPWERSLYLPNSVFELFTFSLLIIMMGFAGKLIVWLNERILYLRESWTKQQTHLYKQKRTKYGNTILNHFLQTRTQWAIVVSIITSILTFPKLTGTYLSLGSSKALEDLFVFRPLTHESGVAGDWSDSSGLLVRIPIFVIVRYLLSVMSIPLPMPGGIYLPVLLIGAACGRLFGEILSLLFPYAQIVPAVYAIIGASALTASATNHFSAAFVLIEILGIGKHFPTIFVMVFGIRAARKLIVSLLGF